MTFSISEITTVAASFAEDLAAYRAAGCDGIGIWEFKLPPSDEEGRRLLRESGLTATNCLPAVPTILPAPGMDDPPEPERRVEAMTASIARLATFEPDCVLFLTGPAGSLDEQEARRIVAEALPVLAAAGDRAGVPVALEPMHTSQREIFSFVNSVPEALALISEAGAPSMQLMFDIYHLWDTPTVLDDIRQHVGRFAGVHVSDRREPTRSLNDRLLPGDGVADVPRLLDALDRAGWDGPYDVEIFSDTDLPDSLWALPPEEVARRARASFDRVWRERAAA